MSSRPREASAEVSDGSVSPCPGLKSVTERLSKPDAGRCKAAVLSARIQMFLSAGKCPETSEDLKDWISSREL